MYDVKFIENIIHDKKLLIITENRYKSENNNRDLKLTLNIYRRTVSIYHNMIQFLKHILINFP